MNEQTDNMDAISAAFASMADAAAQFIEACQQAWDTISEIVADMYFRPLAASGASGARPILPRASTATRWCGARFG